MKVTEFIKDNILIMDGAMGTMLYKAGLVSGELPEMWNITHPDEVVKIHKAYYDAGSNVVSTNTFGANILKFDKYLLKEIIVKAVENCRLAQKLTNSEKEKFIAFDMGPLGKLLKPYGDLDFEDAVQIFSESVKIAAECSVDLIFIETMNDSYETKAALIAAKENCNLPVFVSNAYSEDGKLLTGASPAVMASLIEGMGASAIGANCSFGPEKTLEIISELSTHTSLPIIMKPNAGLPEYVDGKTVYDIEPDDFAGALVDALKFGVACVGGCCGTSPEYILELSNKLGNKKPILSSERKKTVISSYMHTVEIGNHPVLIGERINPTGKKRFKQALLENDIDYILSEGLSQQDKGVHVLDVNVGLAGIDEQKMLADVVASLQAVCDLPLQLDSTDACALEKAMRIYNGKPLVNSVNGTAESMNSIFPLIKKYGAAVVALTLDENGIPDTADERIKIAEKIINKAKTYGISEADIIFDPLAMTVSTDPSSALKTLECIAGMHEKGWKTSLGVSNISFGLPRRDILNSTFFSMALNNGLDAAIMNPYSETMMDAYYSFCALSGLDSGFELFIDYASALSQNEFADKESNLSQDNLSLMIQKGRTEAAVRLTRDMMNCKSSLEIINDYIVPALDECGRKFEASQIFLPQLLMAAEAASAAFSVIKENATGVETDKCSVVMATVKGDIHDIGKNIVRLLLENYGFRVIDLGKDVSPDEIVASVIENKARLLGLSALMTTTLPAMEVTVEMVKKAAPECVVFVGGAVVTPEYAESINADGYARDAMEAVRFCESVYSQLK